MGKLTNKEMQDLTAKFGIKDEEAKRLFESFMNSKVEEIRNQARAEAYETVKKQFDLDKKALVESAEKLINESMRNVFLSGERGGPACGWWKVDSTMSKPGNNGSMWHFFLCVKDKNAKSD